jgi:hypothetical protein
MTPQERDLLTNLVSRLRQSPSQQRDAEADQMINDVVRERPDTPYTLAQTVLIQDYALNQAQARIAALEEQVRGQQPQESGGFLSAIFGSSKPPQQPQPQPQQQYQQQAQPAYQPQPAYAPGPWGSPAPQVFGQVPSQPSFLRSAATTAAGIAGGALLFQGIQSLFGGHGYGGFGGVGPAGFGGGFAPQPGITETVVNNYYDSPGTGTEHAGTEHAGFDQAGYDQANFDQSRDDNSGFTDVSFDDNSGGDDFGGGGDDVI